MTHRRSRRVAALVAGAAALALAAPAAADARALLVCSGNGQACPQGAEFQTIQQALDAAQTGDWIQVWPGVYDGQATLDGEQLARQGKPLPEDLTIRGMDRNGVLLDGSVKGAGHGIRIYKVDGVKIENMTGKNFLTGSRNAFFWQYVDGFEGRYLTAHNTKNYGIYAYGSTSTGPEPAIIENSWASDNADSGFYIGECRDCHTVIRNVVSEHNAIGYSGTNAGGRLVLKDSVWRYNAAGIVPNTLDSELDFPQRNITIQNNHVHDNNADDAPRTGASELAPAGYGILLAGGSENIVAGNLVENQDHAGIAVEWLYTPAIDNQIRNNVFRNVANGPRALPGDADITFGLATFQNCVQNNVDVTDGTAKPASMNPENVADLYTCEKGNPARDNIGTGVYGPGSPTATGNILPNVAGVSRPRNPQLGPDPAAQETMPNPCAGAPDSAWCDGGNPTVSVPSTPN